MDCCDTKNNGKHCKDLKHEEMKGGTTMRIKKSTLLWVAIGILLAATLFLTFKASSISSGVVQAASTAASSAASGMVGGC